MTFPFQLHQLLSQSEELGLSDIVSWHNTGDKFIILKPNEFTQRILPSVFRQTKFSSFKRQLNAYGFLREINSTTDMDTLIYYNEHFQQGNPGACEQIVRRRPGQTTESASGSLLESCEQAVLQQYPMGDIEPNQPAPSILSMSTGSTHTDGVGGQQMIRPLSSGLLPERISSSSDDHILDELAASLDYPEEEIDAIKGASGIIWDPKLEERLDQGEKPDEHPQPKGPPSG